MLHCGVAVDMNYGLNGSGSYSNDASVALNKYFKYNTRLYTRDIYTKAEWMNMIFEEISNGRPILYGGVTAQNAGHAFVFDGYDADGLVHVTGDGVVAAMDILRLRCSTPTQEAIRTVRI